MSESPASSDPAAPTVAAFSGGPRPADLPREIGPFKILKRIGEGGMGVVFLARQEHPKRVVALKVIHAGGLSPRTLSRFEQEAEMLARLQHPGIAQIYQAGTHATEQGVLPYFALEYVEGGRIDQYAQEQSLSIRARLELAARIADAVEHAHQKGVIHRDLKPANILVTREGQPKVLDFGVARLMDDDTRSTTLRTDKGALVGTLPYMSPEQAGGDPDAIDARSDVYSLGIVIYELLTGRLPLVVDRAPLLEAVRVIQEDEPRKLSSHDRALRGDVETIVQKALEKDKDRRYLSAQALADDLRRHLADEPISARPPSTWYQLTRFTRRNRILVSAVTAVLLTLVAGIAVSTRLYLREREANVHEREARHREREASEREREARLEAEAQQKLAEVTAAFLFSMFESIDPAVAQGADTTLLQRLLGDARARLSQELLDQPEVEARLRSALGNAYSQLSLLEEAEIELERAYALELEQYGIDDRRTLSTSANLASVSARRGDLAAAEERRRSTLERQMRVLGPTDPDTLHGKHGLADVVMRRHRYREAEILLREVLEEQERLPEPDILRVISTKATLAQTLGFQDRSAEARELLEEVLAVRSERLGDDHPLTIAALGTLASCLDNVGEYAEAEAAQREALDRSRRVCGDDNQQTLTILNNLAVSLESMRRFDEAEPYLRECLEGRRRVLGEENVETLGTLNHLAGLLESQGRLEEADELALENLEVMVRALGEDHAETLRARFKSAQALIRQSRQREAAEQLGEIATWNRKLLPEDDPYRAMSLYNWAGQMQDAGDLEASEPILREALELVEQHALDDEPFVPAAWNALAKVLEAQGKHDEADELFLAALEVRRERHGALHAELALSLKSYGDVLFRRGDPAAAEALLAELVSVQSRLLEGDDWNLAFARQLHGRCLMQLGRYEEAEVLLHEACESLSRAPDAPSTVSRDARAGILELYAAWDAAEPGAGIGERALRWQEKFPTEE